MPEIDKIQGLRASLRRSQLAAEATRNSLRRFERASESELGCMHCCQASGTGPGYPPLTRCLTVPGTVLR